MVNNVIKFLASRTAPNPIEVDYWVDTTEDPAGAIIKVYRNNKWESMHDTPEGYKELETKVDELDKEVGNVKDEITKFGSSQGIIELQIGNTDQVKASNLEALTSITSMDHTFFVDIDYGYGTGQWLPSVGGSAFIITSEGHAVAYNIDKDGAVIKSTELSIGQKATDKSDGLMSKEDKEKLDSLIQIPSGGIKGQVLTKADAGVAWADTAAGVPVITPTNVTEGDTSNTYKCKITQDDYNTLTNSSIATIKLIVDDNTIVFTGNVTNDGNDLYLVSNYMVIAGPAGEVAQAMYAIAQVSGPDMTVQVLRLGAANGSRYGLLSPDAFLKIAQSATHEQLTNAIANVIPTIEVGNITGNGLNVTGTLTTEDYNTIKGSSIVRFRVGENEYITALIYITNSNITSPVVLATTSDDDGFLNAAYYFKITITETEYKQELRIISTASDDNDGFMSSNDYTKLKSLPTKEQLYTDWYGVAWNDGDQDPILTRIGNLDLHKSLPIQSAMRGCVVLSDTTGAKDGLVLYLNDDWSGVLASNGLDIDLTKENIMVEIPEYWYIDEYNPTTHRHELKMSAHAQAGWHRHKKSYVSAYEGFINADGVYKSLKGQVPTVSKSRAQFRTAARLNGVTGESKWNIYTYAEHRAITHLFMVEYATRYSQDEVKALTTGGYHQGGLGSGCTTGTIKVNGVDAYSFIPTGSSDSLGNGTGEVIVTVTSTDAEGNATQVSRKCNRYRGIENPFGHVFKHCDDLLSSFDANTQKRSYFMCEDPAKFADSITADYKFVCSDDQSTTIGWKVTIVPTSHCDLFTMNVMTSTSTPTKHWTDYNYENRSKGTRCLLIGGKSDGGSGAGLVYFGSDGAAGAAYGYVGCRVTYII